MSGWVWGGVGVPGPLHLSQGLACPSSFHPRADRCGPGEPSLQATVLSCCYTVPTASRPPRCRWGPPSYRSILALQEAGGLSIRIPIL